MSPLVAFVERRGLGVVESLTPLGGTVSVPGAGRGAPALCLTDRGLWLVVVADRSRGEAFDLTTLPFRYELGRFSDTLIFRGKRLAVKRRAPALGAIALGRVRGREATPGPAIRTSRHVEAPDDVGRAWLGRALDAEETLLVWMRTATEERLESPVLGDSTGPATLLVTDRRAELVAISPAGDVERRPLQSRTLTLESRGRAVVRSGSVSWTCPRATAERFAELAKIPCLDAASRHLEIARLNWLGRAEDDAALGFARRLLDGATLSSDARALAAAWGISHALGEPEAARPDPTRALPALSQSGAPARTIAEVWSTFGFSVETGRALLDVYVGRGMDAEPWAAELHRTVRQATLARGVSRAEEARTDVALADHLVSSGDRTGARSVLEQRLTALPGAAVEDLLPPEDHDLTLGAGTQLLRARKQILERLVELRGDGGRPDAGALAELARLEPLVPVRLARVVEHAGDALRVRAEAALGLLGPGGLDRVPGGEPLVPTRALPRELLDGVLPHPLARKGEAMARLLALIAEVQMPDYAVLRDYCAALRPAHERAASALDRAARAFGLDGIEGYVSRGRKAYGVRAYEASPPFVLLGGKHLDDEALMLDERELAFVLGAEMAHLEYEHGRVTSDEVWAGAWDKSKQGLDLALGVLPVLKGWRFADTVASHLRSPTVTQLVKTATAANDAVRRNLTKRSEDDDGTLAPRNEELVAAHRVMQLTADRAGLVLAADLRAAVRSLFLVRRDYVDALDLARREGLGAFLRRRSEGGDLAYLDLAVRTAALVAFFLSDDYVVLREALVGERRAALAR